MLSSILIGVFLGATQVGVVTWRTITVYEGKPILTLLLAPIIATTVWFSMNYVVQKDYIGFASFSAGGAIVTTLMATKKYCKIRKHLNEE